MANETDIGLSLILLISLFIIARGESLSINDNEFMPITNALCSYLEIAHRISSFVEDYKPKSYFQIPVLVYRNPQGLKNQKTASSAAFLFFVILYDSSKNGGGGNRTRVRKGSPTPSTIMSCNLVV